VTTKESPIQGVMLRGRIRKYSLENNLTLLTENASDTGNTVRFAVLNKEETKQVINFIKSIIKDAEVSLIRENLPNPVLSKMKVNNEERYAI
ncbi:MAG: hypothetical protein ACKOW9_04165, partial [Candidatus Paceibacterota bacterium]